MAIIDELVDTWSDLNPPVGYTSGHLGQLTELFVQTAENMHDMRARIDKLAAELGEIDDDDERATAAAVLTSLRTQIDLSRPSGAGPSGTGMGGVWAAADGVFYLVLKGDFNEPWVGPYLGAVLDQIEFETSRWAGQEFTIEVRRECLNTAAYMQGTLDALLEAVPGDDDIEARCSAITKALESYTALFAVPHLDSSKFEEYWPVFKEWDAVTGPTRANGYPDCLRNYYQLAESADQIEIIAQAWLDDDIPVTAHIADRVNQLLYRGHYTTLGDIWNAVSSTYSTTFNRQRLEQVVEICNQYGQEHIIGYTKGDKVLFGATPSYLVDLVTGGEDFAIDYLTSEPRSQLYLTASKNTSLLTMINILVHEASHGFNFVMSARNAPSPLLNLNTSLEVPLTEGQAFYREYQYWAAAEDLLGRSGLSDKEQRYLDLYKITDADGHDLDAATGVMCAQLETYIWRVIRYVRALCDVRVNGGKQTYTEFIEWAAAFTGLSAETLHGECFVFLAEPGYAPCYAIGGAKYALAQKRGLLAGVSELDFNTKASAMGFWAWPIDVAKMDALAAGGAS